MISTTELECENDELQSQLALANMRLAWCIERLEQGTNRMGLKVNIGCGCCSTSIYYKDNGDISAVELIDKAMAGGFLTDGGDELDNTLDPKFP